MPVTEDSRGYVPVPTAEPPERSKVVVIKKWLVALAAGIASMATCCCVCCGCCGKIPTPMVLYEDDEEYHAAAAVAAQQEKRMANAVGWFNQCMFGCICVPMCCGCCCGACGMVTPKEVTVCMEGCAEARSVRR